MILFLLSYSNNFCETIITVPTQLTKQRSASDNDVPANSGHLTKPQRKTAVQGFVNNTSPIDRLITLFTSDAPEESQLAYRFLCEIPLSSLEPQLFSLLSGASTAKVKEDTARLLLERGSENAFEPLAQYFATKERGIAGFLDSNDYNKVVNLFGRAIPKHDFVKV